MKDLPILMKSIEKMIKKIHRSESFENIYRVILKEYVDIFQCDGASHIEIDDSNKIYTRFLYFDQKFLEYELDSKTLKYNMKLYENQKQKEFSVKEDIQRDSDNENIKRDTKAFGINSFAYYPSWIKYKKNKELKVLGSDVLLSKKTRKWDTAELTAFSIIADITTMFIKNKIEEKKKNDLRSEFIATLSHDLKSPIMSVLRALEGLIENASLNNVNILKDIYYMNSNTLSLIKNLLSTYSFEMGKYQTLIQKVNALKILREEANMYKYLAEEKSLTIDVKVEKGVNYVWACPESLRRVFSNLLSNAVKFAPKDSTIKVKIISNKDNIRFVFINEGEKIPPETRKNIFKKFVTDGIKKSTGLGLYISSLLIKSMKGKIWVKNVNEGIAFFIELRRFEDND